MITSGCIGHVYFCFDSVGDEETVVDRAVCAKVAPVVKIVSTIDSNKSLVLKVKTRLKVGYGVNASPAKATKWLAV